MDDAGSATIRVGSAACRRIADGEAEYSTSELFRGVSAEVLRAAGIGTTATLAFTPLLIRCGGTLILADAGAGPELAGEWGIAAGGAVDALGAAGVSPDEIDLVVVSHGHPDHVGGLSVASGDGLAPAFPRARVAISRREWEFWTGAEGLAYDEGDAEVVRTRLGPVRDAGLLQTVEPGEEIAPGVRTLAAAGHTPGHMAVLIDSGGERAVYIGDAMLHPVTVEHPEWTSEYDHDPVLTEATRRELMRQSLAGGWRWLPYHFGTGRIGTAGGGHRYLPD